MRRASGCASSRGLAVATYFAALSFGTSARADDRIACVAASDRAQEQRSERKLHAAREALLRCAQENCPAVIRKDCAHWLTELDEILPSLVIKAHDLSGKDAFDVRVLVDGVVLTERLEGQALAVDPGAHVVRYELLGALPIEDRILVEEGDKRRVLTVDFRPTSPAPQSTPDQAQSGNDTTRQADLSSEAPRRRPVLPYVVGGIGVVAVGGFAYFGLRGRAEAADLASGCGATKSCTHGQVDPVRNELLAADISLGVGIASLGAALWLYLSAPSDRAPRTSRSFEVIGGVLARGGSVGAAWAF
jgi:hypothetical protein